MSRPNDRLRVSVVAALVAVAVLAPAVARADQVFTVNMGYFMLRGEDGRSENDVLWRNLDFLWYDIDEFNGFTIGGEWAFGIGDYLEVGGGIGYYKQTVPSVYADVIDEDGTESYQELRLRIVPYTAIARFFPLTRNAPVQPYIGAGVGFFSWRYSETGEFVDFSDGAIFRGNYEDEGTEVGPVVVGGVRFPVGPAILLGGEFRYQDATADLDESQGFAGTEIDLGGYTWLATFQIRF